MFISLVGYLCNVTEFQISMGIEDNLKIIFVVTPASGMARYRDLVFRPSVNICNHPSINPDIQVCFSETL